MPPTDPNWAEKAEIASLTWRNLNIEPYIIDDFMSRYHPLRGLTSTENTGPDIDEYDFVVIIDSWEYV